MKASRRTIVPNIDFADGTIQSVQHSDYLGVKISPLGIDAQQIEEVPRSPCTAVRTVGQ